MPPKKDPKSPRLCQFLVAAGLQICSNSYLPVDSVRRDSVRRDSVRMDLMDWSFFCTFVRLNFD